MKNMISIACVFTFILIIFSSCDSRKSDAKKYGELYCKTRELERQRNRSSKEWDELMEERRKLKDYLREKYKNDSKEEGDYMESLVDEEKKKCK